jgi:hypothetical protein
LIFNIFHFRFRLFSPIRFRIRLLFWFPFQFHYSKNYGSYGSGSCLGSTTRIHIGMSPEIFIVDPESRIQNPESRIHNPDFHFFPSPNLDPKIHKSKSRCFSCFSCLYSYKSGSTNMYRTVPYNHHF